MTPHWTLRWLAMLVLIAVSTFAFSAYATAATGPDDEAKQDSEQTPLEKTGQSKLDAEADDQADTGADDPSDAEADTRPEAQRRPQQVDHTPGYMETITRGALLGAVLGGLLGGSVYVLTGREFSPWIIGYSSAGGVLFGTLVGTLEVATREDRADRQLEAADDRHDQRRRQLFSEPALPLLHFDF